jgi:protein-disulfide isomerase
MIAEKFEGLIDIRTVIRQGDEKDAKYFLTLCEKAGKMLTVPTILINGKVIFSTVPHPDELEEAIEEALAQKGFLPKK